MTRHIHLVLVGCALLASSAALGQPRHSIGGAFDKDYKADKKPGTTPTEWSPDDKRRLMGEVSEDFYADAMKAKRAGNLVEAQMLLERALILSPTHEAAKKQLAEIRKKNTVAKATKPPAKEATTRLLAKLWTEAEADARAGRWDEAQLGYRKILAIEPANKPARAKLDISEVRLFGLLKARGEKREQAGDVEGALDAYQLALLHGDDDALSARLERLRQRLAESNRKKSDETYAAALSATQQGNNDKARGLCRTALRLDPSNIQAQHMLERLEQSPR